MKQKKKVEGTLELLKKIGKIVARDNLLNDNDWKVAYGSRIPKLLTKTEEIEKEGGLSGDDHAARLEKLRELQRTFCE